MKGICLLCQAWPCDCGLKLSLAKVQAIVSALLCNHFELTVDEHIPILRTTGCQLLDWFGDNSDINVLADQLIQMANDLAKKGRINE